MSKMPVPAPTDTAPDTAPASAPTQPRRGGGVWVKIAGWSLIGIIVVFWLAIMFLSSSDSDNAVPTLSRDAAYQGSLTLAGIAVFSGALASRIGYVPSSEPERRRVGALLVILTPFALAVIHLLFVARLCCIDPQEFVGLLASVSGILIAIILAGYALFYIAPPKTETEGANNQHTDP